MTDNTKPVLQLALDHENLSSAMLVAAEAVAGGIDWLEAGTPLIKCEGLEAVRALRSEFPSATIVSDSTIEECVEASERYGVKIIVDLLGLGSSDRMAERAVEVEAMGVHGVCVHTPIDAQMRGELPFADLKAVSSSVAIPVSVAGGLNSENAGDAVNAGAAVVIVGGAITKAPDAKKATEVLRNVLATGEAAETEFFKRSGVAIEEVLKKASAADVSDAQHHRGTLLGIKAVVPGVKMIGRALTVWTYPGDWSKPVEAIDVAEEGQVIVVDAGGKPPAIWGEKATMTAIQRKLAGIVVSGAIRDTVNIKKMKFPAFSAMVSPGAGDPKGQGMIGVPINIGGQLIRTGDWIIGDDDGVVVIPQEKAVEVANRAQSVVEREDREMSEIEGGRTLASVAELEKWDQIGKKGKGGQ
jgi:3-hexulose-6-phosphate synthase/6-phospho-3-hexuloisomerase